MDLQHSPSFQHLLGSGLQKQIINDHQYNTDEQNKGKKGMKEKKAKKAEFQNTCFSFLKVSF